MPTSSQDLIGLSQRATTVHIHSVERRLRRELPDWVNPTVAWDIATRNWRVSFWTEASELGAYGLKWFYVPAGTSKKKIIPKILLLLGGVRE